jgi:GT2 family glycosyltransferase
MNANATNGKPPRHMRLSVIIVNYNVLYFLEQALLSVERACKDIEAEIWVVDNHSVDESVAMVRSRFPAVKLIVNQENVGFAKANNMALRQASGEYVLLLNPDTVVEEDTFEKCLAFMDDHPEAGGLGVRMIDGTGKFLPESKRGFPTPWVAFCKTFGLSAIFSKSPTFNKYHLGHISPDEVHEIDVIAGAYMLIRRDVLNKTGLLDESFFMYGEDVDLSYRIQQAGYKNYYFPHTRIIHYKGESTKKGSLNYVRTFYQAMIIFARKHFRGRQAGLFIAMLRLAIYLRASITLLSRFTRHALLPLTDVAVLLGGLALLKNVWGEMYFNNPDYFGSSFMQFNAPLYTAVWVLSVYFSGGYDKPSQLRLLWRGLLFGTLVLAAIYGFLDLAWRNSRALIILGVLWALPTLTIIRIGRHWLLHRNLDLGGHRPRNLVIVGLTDESNRVRQLLQEARINHQFLGRIAPSGTTEDNSEALSNIESLDEVVKIYQVREIIFCSRDVSTHQILDWMSKLGPGYQYKILPTDSLSIIGSHSKNTAGELYTIDLHLRINEPLQKRNKRLLDLLLSSTLFLLFPLLAPFISRRWGVLKNAKRVFFGRMTWVGYAGKHARQHLPVLPLAVLNPSDALTMETISEGTKDRLDLIYARDYSVWKDLSIIWKGRFQLGQQISHEPQN